MSEEDGQSEDEPVAVFVIGAPGAGGPALATALASLPAAGPLEYEPTEPVSEERLAETGDRRTADDAEGAAVTSAEQTGERPRRHTVDGAPRRSLQVPYLRRLYPAARFILCWRPPQEATAQAYHDWEAGRALTHPDLPGWEGPRWCFALTPGWRELSGEDLGTIVARQWSATTESALEDLPELEPSRWGVTSHAALRSNPAAELGRLCGFLGIDPGGLAQAAELLRSELEGQLPHEDLPEDLQAALPQTAEIARKAQTWLADPGRGRGDGADPASRQSPLRSVHTGSMPDLLGRLGSSLLISTYQAGKLIVGRKDGIQLNTHFRNFDQPMGLALHQDRLAIGTRSAVLEYRNMPAAAEKLEPKGTHDACYIFRKANVTGDVRIHDLAYCQGELWFVATGFSCLATLDDEHSFVPRWQPPFISKLLPTDRCHLNGMCAIDDRIEWVTALGTTDTDGGWRENKAAGGVLMNVPTNEIVLDGLSMPHSPRWHDGRLWFLESGRGRLCVADPEAGTYESVCELPGFTRGLAFAGPLAFVGLSQIRETKTFGGLPIEERLRERLCGVWAVDTQTGKIAGFLRFEQAVQEVYDVSVLSGLRKPEIAETDSETTRQSYVIKGWKP